MCEDTRREGREVEGGGVGMAHILLDYGDGITNYAHYHIPSILEVLRILRMGMNYISRWEPHWEG